MRRKCIALLCLALLATYATAADDKINATHDEIRALRDGLLAAIKKKDADAIISFLHPDVVLTVQDGEELKAIRKHDGARAYLERTLTGPQPGVKRFEPEVNVDELTMLYGDNMGIAFGSSRDHYTLADNSEFTVPTRWSATLVKHDGKWKVANLQVSSNPFDNAVLSSVTRWIYWVAGGAAVVGLLVGVLLMAFLRKAPKPGP